MPDWSTQNLWWLKPREEPAVSAGSRGFMSGMDQALKQQAQKTEAMKLGLTIQSMQYKMQQEQDYIKDAAAAQKYLVEGGELPTMNTFQGAQNLTGIVAQKEENILKRKILEDKSALMQMISGLKSGASRAEVMDFLNRGGSFSDALKMTKGFEAEEQKSETENRAAMGLDLPQSTRAQLQYESRIISQKQQMLKDEIKRHEANKPDADPDSEEMKRWQFEYGSLNTRLRYTLKEMEDLNKKVLGGAAGQPTQPAAQPAQPATTGGDELFNEFNQMFNPNEEAPVPQVEGGYPGIPSAASRYQVKDVTSDAGVRG